MTKMRKYSREQVKAMSQTEYESLICKELNDAGFRDAHGIHGESEYVPSDAVFGGGIVHDFQAVEFLKRIGLIDNGKCPMCSVKEDDMGYRLQNHQSGAIYHVCKSCYKRYARQEQTKRAIGCCLGVFIIFAAIIAFIVWGILK